MKMFSKISLVAALFISSSAAFAAPTASVSAADITPTEIVAVANVVKPAMTPVVEKTVTEVDATTVLKEVTCTVEVSAGFVSFSVSWCCANCKD
jgi:hypothetical protein